MDDLSALIERFNLPSSLLLLVAFGFSVASGVRIAAESYEKVAKLLGPLGRRWIKARDERIARAADVVKLQRDCDKLAQTCVEQAREIDWLRRMRDDNAWTADMERQNRELAAIVRRLRDREEIKDAYLVYEADWHRRAAIAWSSGEPREVIEAEVPEHRSYLDFERDWQTAHATKGHAQ